MAAKEVFPLLRANPANFPALRRAETHPQYLLKAAPICHERTSENRSCSAAATLSPVGPDVGATWR